MLDGSFIQLTFAFCIIIMLLVMWVSREAGKVDGTKSATTSNDEFKSFQRRYLGIYLVAMFADWLQGPYVYALYASYGYSAGDNATLFVAGFGSSMIFGTFIGSMADRIGRKKSASLYCIMYIASCMTKHVSNYWVLMVGRVTGGIATSLLFSVFDSWLVCEHNRRGFDPDLLGNTFGLAIFGNSLVAIAAGMVSQMAADFMPLSPPPAEFAQIHVGGYCGPFDVSIVCLLICAALITYGWTENYGEESSSANPAGSNFESMKEAGQIIITTPEILCCGVVCSLFEASMFIFVFQWTPLVTDPNGPAPPYGLIFATFMAACMLGSRFFSLAIQFMSVEQAGLCMLIPAVISHLVPVISADYTACFCSFIIFELCVGIYFPMMGTLKSAVVPEGCRSTIYNLYRLPLNFIVVTALLVKIGSRTAFMVTTLLLSLSLAAQVVMINLLKNVSSRKSYEAVKSGSKGDKDIEAAEMIGVTSH